MLPGLGEVRADAETRLVLNGLDEPFAPAVQLAHGQVEHGHLHAAGNVHADGVGDDRVVGGQHAADGQTIADVRVRHQRARDRHGELARASHLVDGLGFESFAPLPPRGRGLLEGAIGLEQRLGKLAAQLVGREVARRAHDGLDLGGQLQLVTAFEDEVRDEGDAAAGGFAGWDPEGDKIFGVHDRAIGARTKPTRRLEEEKTFASR